MAGKSTAFTRTGWSVRRLAGRLAFEEKRLAALTAGDVCVSAAFDLSYCRLTLAAARLFRRLALVEGPDVGAACAAQLTGQPLTRAALRARMPRLDPHLGRLGLTLRRAGGWGRFSYTVLPAAGLGPASPRTA